MGMTIDEALEILDNIPTIGEQVDALEMAIEIMCKYQKIEQILQDYQQMPFAPCLMKGHKCAVHEIREVLEDGED